MPVIDLDLFGVVPTIARAERWAGRPSHCQAVEKLIRGWGRRHTSEIDVLWADFGQGKSHTLLFMQNQVKARTPSTLTHYVQLPPLTTGSPFVALYRQIMQDFPIDEIARRVLRPYRDSPVPLFQEPHALRRAVLQMLWLVGTSAPTQEIARRWLRGDSVYARELSQLQIRGRNIDPPAPPTKAQDCQNTLGVLIDIATTMPDPTDFVLLIDEFQRIGELSPGKRTEVCNALHLIFNTHPERLRLILAFAGGLPEIVDAVMTDDLKERIRERLDLPPMSIAEGVDYVRELIDGSDPDATFGEILTEEAAEMLVSFAGVDRRTLSPRRINLVFDRVLSEALDARDLDGLPLDALFTRSELEPVAESIQVELRDPLEADG